MPEGRGRRRQGAEGGIMPRRGYGGCNPVFFPKAENRALNPFEIDRVSKGGRKLGVILIMKFALYETRASFGGATMSHCELG